MSFSSIILVTTNKFDTLFDTFYRGLLRRVPVLLQEPHLLRDEMSHSLPLPGGPLLQLRGRERLAHAGDGALQPLLRPL